MRMRERRRFFSTDVREREKKSRYTFPSPTSFFLSLFNLSPQCACIESILFFLSLYRESRIAGSTLFRQFWSKKQKDPLNPLAELVKKWEIGSCKYDPDKQLSQLSDYPFIRLSLCLSNGMKRETLGLA